jgi:DNA polymerase-1
MSEGAEEHVVLIDGTGLLVRCLRAARHAPRLSYEEADTTVLTFFAGSLTAALGDLAPTHAVTCWDGPKFMTWRRDVWPEYKPPRSGFLAPAAISPDESLCRSFCGEGGLTVSESLRFEGDDLIAAWWRRARRAMPEARVTILTADRDLFQLCDERTAVRDLGTKDPQVTTEQDVRDHWGCEPRRLPLLRALAGDPADGIPGVRGIGETGAVKLAAAHTGDDAALLAGIIEQHERRYPGDESAKMAAVWRDLMDLREPAQRPWDDDGDAPLLSAARWDPSRHARQLDAFLAAFGLKRLRERLSRGDLPWPSPPPD